jgi:hypothetical protein
MCATLFWQGEGTPKRIAEVLEILYDGQWHLTEEIRNKTKLTENQVKQIADFLQKYDFVAIDEANDKVRLNDDVRKFLRQTTTP